MDNNSFRLLVPSVLRTAVPLAAGVRPRNHHPMTPGHHEDSSTGFVYVWEFTVDPKWQAEFERAYGPDGAWAQLFKKHSGYRRTQLLRHNADPLKYWTVDHWDSEASQRDFRLRFSAEFEYLDHRREGFAQKEELLGEFSLVVQAEPSE